MHRVQCEQEFKGFLQTVTHQELTQEELLLLFNEVLTTHNLPLVAPLALHMVHDVQLIRAGAVLRAQGRGVSEG